jgi:hypothetical protein
VLCFCAVVRHQKYMKQLAEGDDAEKLPFLHWMVVLCMCGGNGLGPLNVGPSMLTNKGGNAANFHDLLTPAMELELKGALADEEILGDFRFTDFFRRSEQLNSLDLLPPLQFVIHQSDRDKIVAMIQKVAGTDGATVSDCGSGD